MFSFKRCLFSIGLGVLGCAAALATPPLTVVQDVLFNADGTQFNGIATISWQSFVASDMSNIPAHSLTTQVVNGLLRVQLVPTTNALSPASYTVVYSSSGNAQFTESWAVPSSNVPLRVRDIRIGGAGSIVGAGGGSAGGLTATVTISDVNGLPAALNLRPILGTGYTASRAAVIDATGALNGAAGNATDCVHVDGSSAPCASGTGTGTTTVSPLFVDGEIPGGTINGANSVFTLGNAPAPTSSLMLFRNGALLRQGPDYTLTNNQVVFGALAIPQTNDILIASYRMGANSSGITFIDGESPAGNIDGSNTVFTLTQAPNPVGSLALYRNGLRLRANLDYTASSNQIVFQAGLAPQTGDVLQCSYRLGGH